MTRRTTPRPPKKTPRRHRKDPPPRGARPSRPPPRHEANREPLVVERDGVAPPSGGCVVLYKDNHVVFVDKGPGLLTVKTDTGNPPTVMGHLHQRLKGAHDTLFPVHRLDRDTSGVLVVARTRSALGLLVGQLRERAFKRIYVALVHGQPPKAGTIVGDLGTVGRDLRMRTVASGEGQLAITHFRVVEQAGDVALLAIKLETGRRNQIRAQMAELGFPLLGEQQYADRSESDRMPRQALHSHRLAIAHPMTGRILEAVSPMPEDMARAWARAGGKHGPILRPGLEIPGTGGQTFELSEKRSAPRDHDDDG